MCNPFDTGSPTVDRMCRLQFTGNVIPSTWYHTIKKETGKPNLNAIIILADIVYSTWVHIDTRTGTGQWKSGMR